MKAPVAVIGLGNMGKYHVQKYAAMESVSLKAVCDADPQRVREFSEQYACAGYTSVEALLEQETIEAVSITVPTQFHYDVALKVMNNGIHCLIEKPIAATKSQAEQICTLAKEKSLTVMIGHVERFNPAIIALKEKIERGDLGPLIDLYSKRVGPYPKQIKDAGVEIDLAVHDIQIICDLLQETPLEVAGKSSKINLENQSDTATYWMSFKKATATVHVDWLHSEPERHLTVVGSQGVAKLDYAKKTLSIQTADGMQNIEVLMRDQLEAELTHFIDCIRSKTPPLIPPEMGLNALEIAEKIA